MHLNSRTTGRRGDWPRGPAVRALLATLALCAGAARGDVVHRRGTEAPLAGEIIKLDDNGVTLRSELGAMHVVPWDHVRDLETARDDPRLGDLLETATSLWRARSRVQRYDTMLAEPLFERLWPSYVGATHETALVVAEGLLRCRLARGDWPAAIVPALEVARLLRAGVTTDSYSMLPPVVDAELALCPQLPPVWLASRSLAKLPSDLQTYDPKDDEVVAALRGLYTLAAQDALGMAVPPSPASMIEHPGAQLLAAVIRANLDLEPSSRAAQRERLLRSLETLPAWAGSWVRFAVGTSLLREDDVAARQEGLWHLAHVPAVDDDRQPVLSELALERMVVGLRASGDDEGAAALEAELQRLRAR